MILPTLSDVPVHHPDCCLSISDNLFSVLEHATSAIPGSVLSIGAGTGLFEAILASRDRTRVVEGVEVSSSVNKYLPEESAYVVSGTWDLCSRARDAAIWIFVYPRVPELVKRYFNTFGNSNVRLAIFLGPRADWADFQDSFQAPEFTSPDVIEECGLVPYEMMAIVNRPQASST